MTVEPVTGGDWLRAGKDSLNFERGRSRGYFDFKHDGAAMRADPDWPSSFLAGWTAARTKLLERAYASTQAKPAPVA